MDILSSFPDHFLRAVPEDFFLSRHDPEDRRMGDILRQAKRPDTSPFTIALLGVPQDIGVERNRGRIGAAQAPDAIRRWLYNFTPFTGASSLETAGVNIIDLGNLIVEDLSLEEIHERQRQIIAYLTERKIIPVTLGGGHDIAYPDSAGFGSTQKEFGVINIDPHTDVRPLLPGGQAHSGSPFRQMLEDASLNIPTGAFVEFGTQSFAVSEAHVRYLTQREMKLMWYHEIRAQDFLQALQTAYEQATSGKRALFVSFDMDAVHSADAPGVSATAPIGFTGYEFCQAAYFFGQSSLTGMMDLAEVNPRFDSDGRTAKLAALTVMHFLAGLAARTRT